MLIYLFIQWSITPVLSRFLPVTRDIVSSLTESFLSSPASNWSVSPSAGQMTLLHSSLPIYK